MERKKEQEFVNQFSSITEQEEITNEVMNSLEGGDSCASSCLQSCKKKNLKTGNDIKQPQTSGETNLVP